MTEQPSDVVIVGAGIVGAACACFATRAGLRVTVVDRGPVGGGTTSRGEGNILVSDKGPGPELDLALLSNRLWHDLGTELGPEAFELEYKGGLVVSTSEPALAELQTFSEQQAGAGVESQAIAADELREHEPHLAGDLPGGVLYPQDLQVQPVLAAAALLRAARQRGARFVGGTQVIGLQRVGAGHVSGVLTTTGRLPAGAVINATGTWGGELSVNFGAPVPVLPRRGFILVTEPLPRVVRHKVYSADYVANVASSDAALETSVVVEGTKGGTVLIGASRERVGFDATLSIEVIKKLSAQAVRMFPILADVQLMRVYRGFRPYCPDHLPVIGADLRIPGLYHACGHEGAGIGLAPGTGLLIAEAITGSASTVDLAPFDPMRFAEGAA
jgi:glycine/D-amino acid oxidase-like deaminating enzyme